MNVFKNLLHFIHKFSKACFQALGAIWLTISLLSFFFSKVFDDFAKGWWGIIAIIAVIFGIYKTLPRKKISMKIFNDDVEIQIIIGDIFKSKNPIIVAAPTTFDTNITDGSISPKSIQGKFCEQYATNISVIASEIREFLPSLTKLRKINKKEKPFGPTDVYKPGTIIPIKNTSRQAYFVAFATFNKHKVVNMEIEEFLQALPAMWLELKDKGEHGEYDIALIGSGFSRINLTKKQVLQEIVKSFVASCTANGSSVTKLNIYISKADYTKYDMDFSFFEKLLEFETGNFLPSAQLQSEKPPISPR